VLIGSTVAGTVWRATVARTRAARLRGVFVGAIGVLLLLLLDISVLALLALLVLDGLVGRVKASRVG
jgi:hypothetical protein